MAVFYARRTLLLDKPELAKIESPDGKLEPGNMLALTTDAEHTKNHPIATTIAHTAQTREIRPDSIRNPNQHPELRMTAMTSNDDELCVSNHALLLEQRISIASAEQRIAELETHGKTVMLVTVKTRLIGLLTLQNGLHPGAHTTVQHLLNTQIEPMLMSDDAHETCKAIGKSLNINHIRPKILPAQRNDEMRHLGDTDNTTTVLGHAKINETTLNAANVTIALTATKSTPDDFTITLTEDNVHNATLTLTLARRTQLKTHAELLLTIIPALIDAIAIAFGILPAAYAPIATLLSTAITVTHVKTLEQMHGNEKSLETIE